MMKEIVKQHPLRPIILEFDEDKPKLDFEIKALDAYYRQHDRTWDAKQQLLQHKDALFALEVKITELEYLLLPTEQQLEFLEAGFQLTDQSKLPFIEEEFTIDVGDFNKGVLYHNQELIELHSMVVAEQEWFNAWADHIYENEDWFDEEDDIGHQLIHKVFRHYEEVSVDIVSLDRDQQEFFDAVGEVTELQSEYFDYGEAVFKLYTALHERSEKVYRRAERLNDHIDKNIL
ncbi:hypothetical protein [Parapedobacter soli]|uniref:hypothetical protein n=1 Tax=Parapedobacter soli TaxID=416955 RepID=UPI0021C9F70A|nr:hypothetical protein [Parapedobacter soli]